MAHAALLVGILGSTFGIVASLALLAFGQFAAQVVLRAAAQQSFGAAALGSVLMLGWFALIPAPMLVIAAGLP